MVGGGGSGEAAAQAVEDADAHVGGISDDDFCTLGGDGMVYQIYIGNALGASSIEGGHEGGVSHQRHPARIIGIAVLPLHKTAA